MELKNVLKYSYTELIDLFEKDFPSILHNARISDDWRVFEQFLK